MPQLYKGDVEPKQAFEMLKSTPNSILVDVRTKAEWTFVGYADLRAVERSVHMLEWREFPKMEKNLNFIEEFFNIVPDKSTHIFFLCRTGGRSQEAAIEMTRLGYENCYNIAYGFEGQLDPRGHRGAVSGWKASNLPWRQD